MEKEQTFVTVAQVTDLPAAGGLAREVNGKQIALFKTDAGIFAVDALCPHRGAPLWAGWAEGSKVNCAMHGWEFDLRTGICKTAQRHISTYPVRVVGTEIQVHVD